MRFKSFDDVFIISFVVMVCNERHERFRRWAVIGCRRPLQARLIVQSATTMPNYFISQRLTRGVWLQRTITSVERRKRS